MHMTPDYLGVVFTHPLFAALVIAAAISGTWYYASHGYKVAKRPHEYTILGALKIFLYGHPLALLGVLVLVILALVLYNWIVTGHPGLWI